MNAVATPAIAVAGTGADLLFAWGVFAGTGSSSAGFTEVSDAYSDPAEIQLVALPSAPVVATESWTSASPDWTIVGATFETE